MKRIDKVKQVVREYEERHGQGTGVTAEMVATALGILRNEASRDLNTLVKMGILRKSSTYPINFSFCIETAPTEDFEQELKNESSGDMQAPFSNIIGYAGSLRNQIKTARAAALYPPNGLNMFIVGESGVGKTMLAREIWRYMCMIRDDPKIPFMTYNCAEYADNPQLLLSHLFGHVKGAFTGADRDKPGVVELANRGLLLLDEIHRLSRTGQEMLFTIMDTGTLTPLGSVASKHVSLMIIGATTEQINSALLDTFKRRMPITIRIPRLNERSLQERLDLIILFFSTECRRLSVSIYVHKEVIKYLITFDSKTNIGDLKNEVQICCAKGYLRYVDQATNSIEIQKADLSRTVLLMHRDETDADVFINSSVSQEGIWIYPDKVKYDVGPGPEEKLLRKSLISQAASSPKNGNSSGNFSLVVWKCANDIVSDAQIELATTFKNGTVDAVAQYLEQIQSNANQGNIEIGARSTEPAVYTKKESNFIRSQVPVIKAALDVSILEDEIELLALVLKQHQVNQERLNIVSSGIKLVLLAEDEAHIQQMAALTNNLLDTNIVRPVQLFPNQPVESNQALLEVIGKCREGDGVIILTNRKNIGNSKRALEKITKVKCYILPRLDFNTTLELAKTILVFGMTQNIESIYAIAKRRNFLESAVRVFTPKKKNEKLPGG